MAEATQQHPTLEQRRAAHAWRLVDDLLTQYPHHEQGGKQVPQPPVREFATQVKKLPSRTLAAGLGQALAFLLAKGYAPQLVRGLSHWVLYEREAPGTVPLADVPLDALMAAIIEGDSYTLRRQTDEALAYLTWVRRFSDARGATDEPDEVGNV